MLLGVRYRRLNHVRVSVSVCRTVWPRAVEEIRRASGQSPAGDPVIHGCGRVICLRAAEPTCAAMLRGLAFIVISGRKAPLTHAQTKVRFTSTSCRHTFIAFPRVDPSRAAPSPGSLGGD